MIQIIRLEKYHFCLEGSLIEKLQIVISISYLASYWRGFRNKLFYGSVWIMALTDPVTAGENQEIYL